MAAAAPPHHLRNRRRLCYLRLARPVVGPAGRDIRAARRRAAVGAQPVPV